MKKHYILIGFTFFFLFSCKEEPVEISSNYKIVGYIAGWKDLDIDSIDPFHFTHINYAFANVIDGKVTEGEGRHSQDCINLAGLNALKNKNPELKILISIGGWTWSKGFSDAVYTDAGRKELTSSAIDFLIKHRLDGLDFDWEYPALPGDDNPFRAEDKENFVLMLKSVREALDSLGALHDKHYLHTIASGGFKEYVDANDLGEAQKYLDFINIMTYDFTGIWDSKTGHHTNLAPYGDTDRSTMTAVKQHIDAGVPPQKLVVGMAFYGKAWKNVNPENFGLFQAAVGWQNYSFRDIQTFIHDNNFEKKWDDSAQAPFLWNEKDSIFITYENEESIKFKSDYIKKMELGGAMFWEYHEDTEDHFLLKALNKHLR